MKKPSIVYSVLSIFFGICLCRLTFSAPDLFRLFELASAGEITKVTSANNNLFFYFHSHVKMSISIDSIMAFFGVIITPIVALVIAIVILIRRKIKSIEEEALYQRFKERMEHESKR